MIEVTRDEGRGEVCDVCHSVLITDPLVRLVVNTESSNPSLSSVGLFFCGRCAGAVADQLRGRLDLSSQNLLDEVIGRIGSAVDILRDAGSIPYYAYGDNQAACEMSRAIAGALEELGSIADHAQRGHDFEARTLLDTDRGSAE
jgi:hypothetical protein